MISLFFFVFLFAELVVIRGLDVSWIGSDADGPLPLSENYRQSLRSLCVLMQGNSRLPPELEAKRTVLDTMCIKLKTEEESLDGGDADGLFKTTGGFQLKWTVGALACLAFAYFRLTRPSGWTWFGWISGSANQPPRSRNPFRSGTSSSSNSGSGSSGSGAYAYGSMSVEELREARLKRLNANVTSATPAPTGVSVHTPPAEKDTKSD